MTAPASQQVATAVVDALLAGGVEHVVLAPGSRSAPLALALWEAHERLSLHTRIDERSAAFLALGIAKTSRKPVAVVTTSGTAVANLHPAVLEAHHSGIALVALTADRPARLRGTNAVQTTDQAHLFGSATEVSADIDHGEIGAAVAALAAALTHRGPSQVNLQFDGPLVAEPARDSEGNDAETTRDSGVPAPARPEFPGAPSRLGSGPVRTVVVAGDDAGPGARSLAEQNGWPLLAEPTSGCRTGTHAIRTYRLLLADESLAGRIERVIVTGHPTISRPVTALISRTDLEVVGVSGPLGVTDPGGVIKQVVGMPGLWLPEERRPPVFTPWLDEWLARDAEVGERLDAFLDDHDELLPHHVAREVAEALPDGGLLFVGASNPIRDLDLVAPRYPVGGRRMITGNRGLAGIDGTVSSAIGAALGRPHSTRGLALVGDLTFLHDANGLLIGPGEPRPDLMLVVVNDDGGSIFALLEQGDPAYADAYDKLFGSPHQADIGALCQAYGVPYRQLTTRAGLEAALATPKGGIEVVEAVVRRDNRRELDATIRALV